MFRSVQKSFILLSSKIADMFYVSEALRFCVDFVPQPIQVDSHEKHQGINPAAIKSIDTTAQHT